MPLRAGFLKDFGGFGGAKWRHVGLQNRTKFDVIFRSEFLKKPCLSAGKTMILKVLGVEVGTKNRSKIYEKMKSSWEGILASIFHGFFVDFGGKVGAKLGSKIDEKSIQKGIEKQMRKRRRKSRQRSASWAVLARKEPRTLQGSADTRGPV